MTYIREIVMKHNPYFIPTIKRRKSASVLAFLPFIAIFIFQPAPPMTAQSRGAGNSSTAVSGQALEGVPPTAAPNDSLKGLLRVSAEMQFQTGNLERFMFRGGVSGELRNSSFALMSSLSYSQQYVFGQQLEDDWFGFVNVQALPNSTIYPVGFMVYETSKLRFLEYRLMGGAGAGVQFARSQAVDLSLSAVVVYDQTRFRSTNSYEGWRYSFHLYGRYTLADGKIVLTHNFFSQPTALFTSNYRHRLIAMLMIPITHNFSISSTLDYSYETVVDETRKQTNIFNAVGLTWSF